MFGFGYGHILTVGILRSITEVEDKWRCENSVVHAVFPGSHFPNCSKK